MNQDEIVKEFIPQMRPYFGAIERAEIESYLAEDGYMTEFSRTKKFEDLVAEFTGAKHCIVVNNGTISLTVAAMALDIQPGDEIIVPNYTMIATPNSIKMLGAKPIFVDVELSTLCLDLQLIERQINTKTKAIILVSPNGRYPSYKFDELRKLADKYQLKIIEDAAQALGSFYPTGKHIGTLGDIGSFSFSAPKIISTGQGGALVTNCDLLAEKIRYLKDFGRARGGNDIHDVIGYNFKFTELQACLGIAQMTKLKSRIERKKKIWHHYFDILNKNKYISIFKHNTNFTTPWFIDLLVKERNKLAEYLFKNKIGTRNMYPPINKQKAYGEDILKENSDLVGEAGIWLPSSVRLTEYEIDYICEKINKFYE